MSSTSLKLLVLKTDDIECLRNFYTCFGFDFVEEQHGNGPRHYAASMGDGILEIYPTSNGAMVDTSTRLGFAIDDMDSVIKFAQANTKVISKPKQTQWGLRAVVRDPDGRSVELYVD